MYIMIIISLPSNTPKTLTVSTPEDLKQVYSNDTHTIYNDISNYSSLRHRLNICTMSVFRCIAFDNDQVANAANPSSFGYHHGKLMLESTYRTESINIITGPIPNSNAGCIPERR